MPFEQVGDQKQIRISQYHQLRSYIEQLASGAQAKRAPLDIRSMDDLRAWQQRMRPVIERALGWPALVPEFEPELISEEEIGSDELVRSIRRMTIRVADGLDVYGIYLLPYAEKPRFMLCFHGGSGCPELVASVCNSTNYNDGARKLVAGGFAVFCPLLVLRREEDDPDWPGTYRTALHMSALWAGTTVMAIEITKIQRTLRYFASRGEVDASHPGIAGLSYGGYYALYTAALLPEVSFAVSSCYFNDRLDTLTSKHGDLLDWQYPGAGSLFGDAEIAALICPRPLYIEAATRDELFDVNCAKREAEKVRAVYQAAGRGEDFLFDAFEGVHEFGLYHIGSFLKRQSDILRFGRENTVSAEKQVSSLIIRSGNEGAPKVLFVGNSITLHGVKPEIGWNGLWGMAASSKDKDYVHQTMRMVRGIAPEAGYMIAQAADWERGFWKEPDEFECLRTARAYDADILVIRLGENVLAEHMMEHDLAAAMVRLIGFLNPEGRSKVIVTDMFWPHPEKDDCACRAAEETGAQFVSISRLGAMDEMKAVGLFEHTGVAAHPGDLGMLHIAEDIFEKMKHMLKGE